MYMDNVMDTMALVGPHSLSLSFARMVHYYFTLKVDGS